MEALAGASFNLHHKLRAREVTAARPGASTHRSRRFYESIYPTKTVRASTQPRINPSDHPRILPLRASSVQLHLPPNVSIELIHPLRPFHRMQVDHVTVPDDVHVKRFTDDGRYLLCFSRNQRELVVYRLSLIHI